MNTRSILGAMTLALALAAPALGGCDRRSETPATPSSTPTTPSTTTTPAPMPPASAASQ